MPDVLVTYRPLTQWPKGRPRTADSDREHARFKTQSRYENSGTPNQRWVSPKPIPLSQTLDDLDRELWAISAQDVVIQVDIVNERNLRNDGGIRADARVHSPAIVLSFRRGRTPYLFACDHFKRWEDNLRALALGLESLRRVDRFHINQAGDQYRGYQALPAATTAALSTLEAAVVLARRSSVFPTDAATKDLAAKLVADWKLARAVYRNAAAATHPDAGGSTSDFQLVQEAKRVLEAHFGEAL